MKSFLKVSETFNNKDLILRLKEKKIFVFALVNFIFKNIYLLFPYYTFKNYYNFLNILTSNKIL